MMQGRRGDVGRGRGGGGGGHLWSTRFPGACCFCPGVRQRAAAAADWNIKKNQQKPEPYEVIPPDHIAS